MTLCTRSLRSRSLRTRSLALLCAPAWLLAAGCGYEPELAGTADGGVIDASGDGEAATLAIEHGAGAGTFGDVVVGRTSAMSTFVVQNRGRADSGRLTAAITGHADFSLADDSCSGTALAPDASCTISIAFAPAADGTRTAELSATASPGGAATAPLDGRGLSPCELAFDVDTHDFGPVAVAGGSAPQTFVLTNLGQEVSAALAVMLPPAAPYTLSDDTCTGATLAGGASCSIAARFLPAAVGTATGSLTIGAPGGCVTAASLGGTGTARVTVARAGAGSGTITSTPAGIDCGTDCNHDFATPAVRLDAAAPAGHTFVGWSGACAAAGTGPCTLALTAAVAATATFETTKVLTVGRAGTGTGTVTSGPSGIACGTQCTATFAHGAQVTLAAAPAAGSSFAGWTGACTGTGACVVAMDAARAVNATFELLVQPLAVAVVGSGGVTSMPAGIACPGDCTESVSHGTPVTLSAAPATGWVFDGWSGACAGLGACQVSMTAARSVTATFAITTPSLTVTRTGTGAGTVTSLPAGIDCGGTCSHAFAFGALVTLSATPAAGSTFAGWSGACSGTDDCLVTIDAARTVQATFQRIQHALSVTRAGTGIGTVTSTPDGIACGTSCTASFDEGTVVALAAVPAAGSAFAGWSGACSGTGACSVAMSAARAVTATFAPTQHVLTVTRTGTGGGTVTSNVTGINCGTDCSEGYQVGTVVTLTATPNTASDFAGWSGACAGATTCQVTLDQARDVTADFVLEQNLLTVKRSGAGTGTVTSNLAGIACGTDCSEHYAGNLLVKLTADDASGSDFVGWSSGCSSTTATTCTVDMSQARTITATFEVPRTLTVIKNGSGAGTVTSAPSGISCGSTCSRSMTGSVTLTATPAAGSGLVKWTGCASVSGATCTVYLSADKTVTATFGVLRTVSVTRTGTGTGSVYTTSVSPYLSCGSTCTASYPEGILLQLRASPSAGAGFAGWSGACSGLVTTCDLVIDANKAVTARFEPTRTLTVTRAGTGTGTVKSNPTGLDCGATCTAGFPSGITVALTATPAAGSSFTGWSGACTGTGACQVTMDAAKSVTATFSSP